ARGTRADAFVRIGTIIGLTIPSFWIGVLMLYFSSLYVPSWPSIGHVPFTQDPKGNLLRMILPVIAVSLPMIAGLTRILRSSLLEVLNQDYIRTARAKGVGSRTLFYRHALRNALIPVVTVIGVQLGYMLSGVVVIEQVFAIPGLGRLAIGAINERNYPLVQGIILVVTAIFVFVNLIVDLAYAWIDPRVEYGECGARGVSGPACVATPPLSRASSSASSLLSQPWALRCSARTRRGSRTSARVSS